MAYIIEHGKSGECITMTFSIACKFDFEVLVRPTWNFLRMQAQCIESLSQQQFKHEMANVIALAPAIGLL